MKNYLGVFFGSVILLWLWSCNDKDDPQPIVSVIAVEFDSTQITTHESIGEISVVLSLRQNATKNGTITISPDIIDASLFTTEPGIEDGKLTLSLIEGSNQTSFKVFPLNNNKKDEGFSATFLITAVSDGLLIGAKKSLVINVNDDEEAASIANFAVFSGALREDETNGLEVTIELSKSLSTPSSIAVKVLSTSAKYAIDYITSPSSDNEEIMINILPGTTSVHFTISAIDNRKLNADHNLNFTLARASSKIVMGNNINYALLLKDDERIKLPKGYSIGGPLGLSKTFNYDDDGRISSVQIQSGNSNRTDVYHYNSQGQIRRINSYPQIDQVFTWSDGKIVRSESTEFGVVKNYTEYDYDAQGNVSGTANYFRQPDGTYTLSFVIVYLYYTDNNLYKSMYYVPGEGDGEYTLLSTRTYGGYISMANPFPMVDILPGIKTMNTLPTSYRVEEQDTDLNYVLRYEYNEDGLVTRRSAWDGQLMETTNYFYY